MTQFEPANFKPFEVSKEEILNYFHNAERDLEIARKDSFSEVQFTYSYQALLKNWHYSHRPCRRRKSQKHSWAPRKNSY